MKSLSIRSWISSYPVIWSPQLLDPDLPVTLLSEQLVDLIVQIPNLELPETSCKTGPRNTDRLDREKDGLESETGQNSPFWI